MASAYGNVVQRWQSYIEASITSQTDTTATITLRVYFHSIAYGFKTYANANGVIDGTSSNTVNFSATSGTGQTVNQLVVTQTKTVSKGSSARNVSVSGRVQLTGGFQNGTSTAYASVSIPARTYYKPHPPKNFAAKRTSDAQMDLTWQGDYTGMDGGYPWTGVYVERQIDDGSWVSIATLNWDAVNYSDKTTAGNHKYEYRVQSYGPGGKSGYATADPLYTTPAAPASVSLTKTTGTEVSLDVDASNAPYATSWDVQESLNGGEWKDVGNYSTFPQTIDVGGGTAKLRARSKRDSLLSGWTESATITTIVAPNAPTLTSKPDAVVATGSIVTVQWEPNHPDGSAQTQAQVEYTVGSGSAQTSTVQGAATSYRLPASATASAGTVSVRVRTHGLDPDWGAWSSYYTFKVAVPPEAHFTTPGIDGAKIGDLPLVVEWSITDSTGVASQSLQLMDGSGKVLHSAAPSTGTRQYTFDASTYQLSNATSYMLRLTVRGGSSLTVTTDRRFATSFAEPARPEESVYLDEETLSQAVTVMAGSPYSDEAEVLEVEATAGTLVPGFTVFGNTRQNLWVNPSGASNGVTVTANDDGSITVNGTATTTAIIQVRSYVLRPGGKYTLSIDKSIPDANLCGASVEWYKDGAPVSNIIVGSGSILSRTFIVPSDIDYCMMRFRIASGVTVSGTYRVMLREATEEEIAAAQQTASTLQEGGTADLPQDHPVTLPADPGIYAADDDFDWCPPGINGVEPTALVVSPTDSEEDGTTAVIDMQGHALYSWEDGTRDMLTADGTGSLSISQAIGDIESYSGEDVGDEWLASALDEDGNPATGAHVIYKLAEPKTVELGSISMPEFPANPTTMWAVSDVPGTVRVDYPDTDSLSVTRVLADGSRWLVAEGLVSGQQAIDPLPPLNTDYAYEVTASTGAGAIVSASFAQRIDSRGRMALNFGTAASVAHVMGANAKVSYDEGADGELYHFADGGESGGLPQFYGTGDIDASGSVSFELMDRGERDRFKRSARRYAVGWFRDAMGGRIRARMGYSESVSAGGIAVWEESVDMNEVIFEEAW